MASTITIIPAAGHLADVHSEDLDSDSLMTDEIEEEDRLDNDAADSASILETGTIDPSSLLYASSGSPVASTSGTSGLAAARPTASTSKATSTSTSTASRTRPAGTVCEFGERLGYTYFAKPVPTAEELNSAHKHTETFWLTVDNDLTYLSFFRDTGPVSCVFIISRHMHSLLTLCWLLHDQLNVACLYRFCLHLHDLLEVRFPSSRWDRQHVWQFRLVRRMSSHSGRIGPMQRGDVWLIVHVPFVQNPSLRTKRIILFSADEPDKKANAALLMALYAVSEDLDFVRHLSILTVSFFHFQMIVLRWSPADALHPVACLELQPFRDAGYARADFHLSLQDIIFGARKAIDHRLLKLDEFNLQEYEYYEKVENGDWNFITPHFLAFASPVENGFDESSSSGTLSPAAHHASPKGKGTAAGTPTAKINKAFRNVLEYFEKNNVKMVVRLNKKLYDERRFIDRGMEHRESEYIP